MLINPINFLLTPFKGPDKSSRLWFGSHPQCGDGRDGRKKSMKQLGKAFAQAPMYLKAKPVYFAFKCF